MFGHRRRILEGQEVNLQIDSLRSDFWEWDQATNIWTQKANFGGIARHYAIGFSINNNGYIGTGRDLSLNDYNDFWKYNPSTNIWTRKANVGGAARHGAVGFSIGNEGYIGTGTNNIKSVFHQDFWEYTTDSTEGGINEVDLENLISVYPNPTKGKINLKITEFENLKMKGVYFLQIKTEQGIVSKKIILQK